MTPHLSRITFFVARLVIILAVPVVLALLPVRVIMQPWIIPFEYGHLPPDVFGMSPAERLRLGLDGLTSVTVNDPEMKVLRQARFDNGELAFTEREIGHMLDVQIVARNLFNAQAVALVLGLTAAALLYRERSARPALASALRTGALVTLLAVLGVGVFVAAAWNSFFTTFHRIFFTGDTWLFAYTDTLIRLYPVQLWIEVTVMICSAIVVEAFALGAAAWWWRARLHAAPNQKSLNV